MTKRTIFFFVALMFGMCTVAAFGQDMDLSKKSDQEFVMIGLLYAEAEVTVTFTSHSSAANDEKQKVVNKPGMDPLTFVIRDGKGYCNSRTEVAVIPQTKGVTFVEITASGNVMTTTLQVDEKGKITAVHSRHTIIMNDIVIGQYIGTGQLK